MWFIFVMGPFKDESIAAWSAEYLRRCGCVPGSQAPESLVSTSLPFALALLVTFFLCYDTF